MVVTSEDDESRTKVLDGSLRVIELKRGDCVFAELGSFQDHIDVSIVHRLG